MAVIMAAGPAMAGTGTIEGYPMGTVMVRDAGGAALGMEPTDGMPAPGTVVDVRADGGVVLPGRGGTYIDPLYVDVLRQGDGGCEQVATGDSVNRAPGSRFAGSPGVDGGCK
ncbi:MAG: hypothetical protein RID91_13510 [Azospirillaceae bacterium]